MICRSLKDLPIRVPSDVPTSFTCSCPVSVSSPPWFAFRDVDKVGTPDYLFCCTVYKTSRLGMGGGYVCRRGGGDFVRE